MKRFARCWSEPALVVVVVLSLGAVASACNVPVFRFALERWRPDPYRLVLFHRGELTEDQRAALRPLLAQQDEATANLALHLVDLADESSADGQAADRKLYEALGEPALPWLVIQYPAHLQIDKPAFAGPLAPEIAAAVSDSPLRRELARRLAEGQTAVWLLLESGQADQDEATLARLERQLKLLEESLELPELTDSPDDALASSLPLKIAFSVLRVPRGVAEEHALVAMLIGCEDDLADRSDPMVFPVFGRGRALLPLIGAGITDQNIYEAAAFLAGPCSCQVKEQNPGFDLLMSADWDTLLAEHGLTLTAVETRSLPPSDTVELVPIPQGSPPNAEVPAAEAVNRSSAVIDKAEYQPLWIAGIVGAILLAILLLVVIPRALASS